MYGVRVMIDGQVADLKIFETLAAAQERFQQGWTRAYEGHFDSIAIYNVPDAKDVRDAAAAIQSIERDRIELVEFQESQDIVIARVAKRITIDL